MRAALAILSFVFIQLALAFAAAEFQPGEFLGRFNLHDSRWYTHIASFGYTQPSWNADLGRHFAFFPLWPFLLKFLHEASGLPHHAIGACVSLVCFICGFGLLLRSLISGQGSSSLFFGGWLALIFSPGSWIFFSNHPEGIFFLLSIIALWRANRLGWFSSGVLAGLAALTHELGLILIASIAIGSLISLLGSHRRKVYWSVGFLFIALSIAALWPVYQWLLIGDPLAALHAQKYLHVSFSISRYLRHLFWFSVNNLPRVLILWSGVIIGFYLIIRRSEFRSLGIFVVISMLILPLRGSEYPDAYRVSAVIFPMWLVIGDMFSRFTDATPIRPISKYIRAFGIITLVVWHTQVASHYFFQYKWPY